MSLPATARGQLLDDGGCSGCLLGQNEPGESACSGREWRGWRVALGAVVVFLLPLVLAIAAAVVARGSQPRQLLGAAVGLCAGVALAWIAGRVLCAFMEDGP